jgi:hypothetical protein
MNKLFTLSASLLLSTAAAFATAQVITPDASGFGALPAATFGGSGIPNGAVAQTTQGGVTLGLTATQRFSNPAVTNDGAGTFFALAGIDTNAPSPGNPYARWNFNFFVGNSGQADNIANYNYRLFYDFNPAAGNVQNTHGYISLPGLAATINDPVQNSYNLGMDFLATTNALLGVTAPPGAGLGTFDPSAVGEYTFKLAAYTSTGSVFTGNLNLYGTEAFNTSMVVVSAIPEPGEWAMMLAGLGVVGAIARRRRNK